MKNLIIGILGLASLVHAGINSLEECSKYPLSSGDSQRYIESSNCFNAVDLSFTKGMALVTPISITTKTSAKDFSLLLTRNLSCNSVNTVEYYLIDNTTNEEIPDTRKSINISLPKEEISFNVPNSYKDVSVGFEYETVSYSNTPKEITCPAPSQYTVVSSLKVGGGIFAVPNEITYTFDMMGNKIANPITYKCYEFPKTIVTHEEKSTDDFAIRPKEFLIELTKSQTKTGKFVPLHIDVVNDDDTIDNNYNNSSMDLSVGFSPSDIQGQYMFDIVNGTTSRGSVSFLNPGDDITLDIVDSQFANVDSDDTEDSCRYIIGSSNSIKVTEASKYWAGTGTDENENNPMTNTIQAKIKQNTKKDLHFQKMSW